ncbi:TadE/TadG family type IV pilus assembly protein [Erythrobacter sp. A6_0]|uniref:TadE/TadG family type IV pilus assembly protein n=1 Tax=Erythrobacter sp. A6_0 TaxID=2821089 RepID=UPI0024691477|nr:TadE/TadG family type IV pilus assembly protein [Erythrobacter sp. A6_0]
MRVRTNSPARVFGDQRGTTIIEFAVVAPVLLMIIIGGMEIGHLGYVKGITRAALQVAARDSGLESNSSSQNAVDAALRDRIKTVIPNASISIQRRSYTDFTDVNTPEDFNDSNGNGLYDPNECFTDMNGNARWDADRGRSNSQGGADDVVLYTVSVSYNKIFPLWKLIGQPSTNVISAETTLRNQPFGVQSQQIGMRICP